MRCLWSLAAAACAVLAGAAVWMGGLNQDEGWYLYAANLVSEGQMPYRDFFYTQGPILPFVYSFAVRCWQTAGLLGARVFTFLIGLGGILLATATAAKLARDGAKALAALLAFLLLATNLYHLYFLAIPKTYALAALFVSLAFFLLASMEGRSRGGMTLLSLAAGLSLAFAAGTRISLGAILPVAGLWLLFTRRWAALVGFAFGGLAGLALVYGPFLADPAARLGLFAAQRYHAARGGFDPVWTIGSFSRLVRWYLPVFALFGAGLAGRVLWREAADGDAPRTGCFPGLAAILLLSFGAVLGIQMLAPFPYEDYQVPVMSLLAVAVAASTADTLATASPRVRCLAGALVLFLSCGVSFGSPLLEKWATNGQDRFWTIKKESYELPQLRQVAAEIERLDPGGKELLTQDLYLAIETNRKVPKGLEMGPFAMLSEDAWRALLSSAPCPFAALSGYSFAIEPPSCRERLISVQMEFWRILKQHYELVGKEDRFGQNATTLLMLKRK